MPRKPGFWVTTEETRRNFRNGHSKHETAYIYDDTYRKLKHQLQQVLIQIATNRISDCL